MMEGVAVGLSFANQAVVDATIVKLKCCIVAKTKELENYQGWTANNCFAKNEIDTLFKYLQILIVYREYVQGCTSNAEAWDIINKIKGICTCCLTTAEPTILPFEG